MVIGSLVTNIVADLSKWGPNLDKANKKLHATVNSVKGAVVGLGGVVAAAFSIGALRSVAEDMDRISKASQRLGVSTENLVGLEHAANLSGVSVDKLAAGLNRVNRMLGSAASGDSNAIKAFEGIGLSIESLSGMSADQVLGKIADQINLIPDAAGRAAAAAEVFGTKLGPGLQDLLKEGSSGLAAMKAEADSLGLTFSGIEGKAIEEANDALTRAGESVKGLARELTITLAPAVSNVATLLKDEVKLVRGGFKKEMEAENKDAKATRIRMYEKMGSKGLTEMMGREDMYTLDARAEMGIARTNVRQREDAALEQKRLQKEANKAKSAKTILESPARAFGALWDKAGQIGGDGASALGGLMQKGKDLEKSAFAATTAQMFGLGPFNPAASTPEVPMKKFGITPGFNLAESGSAESYRQRRAIERQGAGANDPAKKTEKNTAKMVTLMEKVVENTKAKPAAEMSAANFKG